MPGCSELCEETLVRGVPESDEMKQYQHISVHTERVTSLVE